MRKKLVLSVAAALAAVALVLAMAGPALAVTVSVRVQSLSGEICGPLTVDVPDSLTVTDSKGTVVECAFANPLGALYRAAAARSFTFVTTSGGAFLDSIAGLGGQLSGWASWWMYAVNGCIPMVGVLDWHLAEGDSILFFEAEGDPMAPWANKALVLAGPAAVTAGQPVTLTVLGDNLGKANSAADAPRFGLDPTTDVETPDAFAPVAGATVHLGEQTFVSDEHGQVSIPSVPLGTHAVWVQKAYDTNWQYIAGPGDFSLTGTFSDVPATNAYFTAVHALAGAGVVAGYPADPAPQFRPEGSLMRAQFAKMIALALHLDVPQGAASPFSDLGERTAGNPYPHDYVAAVYTNGIVRGVTDTLFDPWGKVSHAQVVTMVVRALQSLAPERLATPPVGYVSSWGQFSSVHAENARIAEYNLLLRGLDLTGAAVNPWAPMTRGETAQVVYNMQQVLKK